MNTIEMCQKCYSKLAERILFSSVERYCANCEGLPAKRTMGNFKPLGQSYDMWGIGEEIPEDDFITWIDRKNDWLQCDGRMYHNSLYTDLYAKIGTKHNLMTDPSGMFRVPTRHGWRIKCKNS